MRFTRQSKSLWGRRREEAPILTAPCQDREPTGFLPRIRDCDHFPEFGLGKYEAERRELVFWGAMYIFGDCIPLLSGKTFVVARSILDCCNFKGMTRSQPHILVAFFEMLNSDSGESLLFSFHSFACFGYPRRGGELPCHKLSWRLSTLKSASIWYWCKQTLKCN